MARKKSIKTVPKNNSVSDMPTNVPLANPTYRDKLKIVIDLAICIPMCVVAAIPMAVTAIARFHYIPKNTMNSERIL